MTEEKKDTLARETAADEQKLQKERKTKSEAKRS